MFEINLQKMKEFFQHEKIQNLINKDRTPPIMPLKFAIKDKIVDVNDTHFAGAHTDRGVVPTIDLNSMQNIKHHSKEDIKKKLEQSNKDITGEVKTLITTFATTPSDNFVKSSEINEQQISFRKRLNSKKELRSMKSSKAIMTLNPAINEAKKDGKDENGQETRGIIKKVFNLSLERNHTRNNSDPKTLDRFDKLKFVYKKNKGGHKFSIEIDIQMFLIVDLR